MASQLILATEPGDEQRKAQRSVTVFALGKLTIDGRETPCFIRDRSEGGVRVESAEVLPVDSLVEIEMRGLSSTRASVRWCRGGFLGLQFCPTADQAQHADPRTAPRGPRFAFHRAVIFRTDHSRFDVEALDLAIGGMKLKTGFTMSPRVTGTITIPDHDIALPSMVVWSRGGVTGTRFVTRLPMDRMFKILTLPA